MFSLLNLQIDNYKSMKFFVTLALFLLPLGVFAQQMSEEEQAKKLAEAIEREVDHHAENLDLEDWQVFYVDSILTANYKGMMDELGELNRSKVSNPDLFVMDQDKWMEKTYVAFEKVFDENQWAKYLKSGAAKEKKSRDKREAKRNN